MTAQLRRALGLGSAAAISTGLGFAALNFLAMGQLLGTVDARYAWLALVAGGVVILVVRAVFAELNGMYPSAAGIRLWLTRATSDRVALVVTFTYASAIVVVIGADAYIIGAAIAHTLHNGFFVAFGYVAALLVAVTALNLRGIHLTGKAELIAIVAVVGGTVVIGLLVILNSPMTISDPAPLTSGNAVEALILAIFTYTGFEWVTANAEEAAKPQIIPRAMLIAIFVLGGSQLILSFAMGRLSSHDLASPFPQLLMAESVLGRVGELGILAVTALTAINTFNAGFVTLSRFLYATAREGKLPKAFTRLNARAVPFVPVYLLGGLSLVLAALVAVTGAFAMMVSVGAALEAFIYAAAVLCVWRLRRREPDRPRPYRLAGGKFVAVPLAVLFGIATLAAGLTVSGRFTPVPLVIVGVIALGVTGFVATVVPRLERRQAAELAARREARAAARAQRRTVAT
jgi:amino acid transporter